MRVYVAGGSSERGIVAQWIATLERYGIEVTHDWTRCEGYDRARGEDGEIDASDEEVKRWAEADAEGVESADVVWYLAPEALSEGSHFELGLACGQGKRVIASGPWADHRRRIFLALVACYPTHEQACEAILRRVARDL